MQSMVVATSQRDLRGTAHSAGMQFELGVIIRRPPAVVFAIRSRRGTTGVDDPWAGQAGASPRAGPDAIALRHRQAHETTYRQASVSRLAKKT